MHDAAGWIASLDAESTTITHTPGKANPVGKNPLPRPLRYIDHETLLRARFPAVQSPARASCSTHTLNFIETIRRNSATTLNFLERPNTSRALMAKCFWVIGHDSYAHMHFGRDIHRESGNLRRE